MVTDVLDLANIFSAKLSRWRYSYLKTMVSNLLDLANIFYTKSDVA